MQKQWRIIPIRVGIKEMIEHFGIQQEETLVIGDSDNDRACSTLGIIQLQ